MSIYTLKGDSSQSVLTLEINQRAYEYIFKSFKRRMYPDNKWVGQSCMQKMDNCISFLGFIYLITRNNPAVLKYKWFAPLFNVSTDTIKTYKEVLAKTMDNFIWVSNNTVPSKNEDGSIDFETDITYKVNVDHYTINKVANFPDGERKVLGQYDVNLIDPELMNLLIQTNSISTEQQTNSTVYTSLASLTPEEQYIPVKFFMDNISIPEIIKRVFAITGKTLIESELQAMYDNYYKPGCSEYNKLIMLKNYIDAIFYTNYKETYSAPVVSTVPAAVTAPELQKEVKESKQLFDDTPEENKKEDKVKRNKPIKLNKQEKKLLRQLTWQLFDKGLGAKEVFDMLNNSPEYFTKYWNDDNRWFECLCKDEYNKWRKNFIKVHNIDLTPELVNRKINSNSKSKKVSYAMVRYHAETRAINKYFNEQK